MTMSKWSLALALALPLAGCSAGGGSPAGASPAPAAGEVVTHTFSASRGEIFRVFLASGVTYEAEVDGGGLQLQVRPADQAIQQPRVEEKMPGSSAGGSSIFTIQPRADGEYEFRTLGGDPGRPLTLRLRMQAPRGEG